MKLTPVKVRWHPVSRKPKEAGVYLIWSKRHGARVDQTHPTWWNYRHKTRKDFNGPRVTRWAYLWPIGHYNSSAHNGEGK